MATIQDYLDLIKNAIYGKDVRQAIHDGIQQCYYDGKAGATDLEARQRLDSDEASISSLSSRMSTAENDINVLDSRVDEIVAPSGSAPSAAEVTDARIGADGVTYANLGEANRTQFSDLKADLASEKDDGLFHRYLVWEHGGIDNATGANNNEGSLVRSRMPEYLLCADYEQITNDTSIYVHLMYYDSEKNYKSTRAILNDTSPLRIESESYKYFRLDMRAGLDSTYHVRAYQKSRAFDLENDVHAQRNVQIYFSNDRAVVEEDTVNGKVYFSASYGLYIRYGINGTTKSNRTVYMNTVATEAGTSLVTSPSGATACIEINDEYALAYDIEANKFVLVHRYSLSNNHIPIVVQNGGYITYAHQCVQKILYRNGNRENFYGQIYFQLDAGEVEEDTTNKKVYFHATHALQVRYGTFGTIRTNIQYTMSDLATALDVSLVTSPKGIENCIAINDEYAFVFNVAGKRFELVHRYSLSDYHMPLIVQNGGFVTYASPYFGKVLNRNTGGSGESTDIVIPTYWNSAIAEAETTINNALASDEDSASWGFVTDTHIGINKGYSGALMKRVMDDCRIPVWFHGGDVVTGDGIISASELVGQMHADFEQFKAIENLGLRAIGNHEPAFGVNSSYDSNLTNAEINHYYHGIDREKFLQIYGREKGYFYKDIHKDKLRCVCLDIIPYESQVNPSHIVTGINKLYYHQFGSEQLEWFADVLASTPSGYMVVVCSHIAPVSLAELKSIDNDWSETVPTDYRQARKIAEAYAMKTSYSWSGSFSGDPTGDTYNIDVDFSSAQGEFVCFFCGHTHKDFMLKLDNVNIVGTANDSFAVSSNATAYAPPKTASTATEQILDFFCIIPSARTVRVVRLGAYLEANGKVRTFTY